MKVIVNGEPQDVPGIALVSELLPRLGFVPDRVAVAVNGEFVPHSRLRETPVREGDEFDILGPQQGG